MATLTAKLFRIINILFTLLDACAAQGPRLFSIFTVNSSAGVGPVRTVTAEIEDYESVSVAFGLPI